MDWQQVFSTSANIISLLTAIGALALSYRVYHSQKSLENENQLFQHKMNQYQIIIQHAAELHGLYYDIALDFKNFPYETLKGPNEFITMAEEVDRETAKFRLILFKHASFLPEEIIEKLDDFYNDLFDQSEIITDEKEVGLQRKNCSTSSTNMIRTLKTLST